MTRAVHSVSPVILTSKVGSNRYRACNPVAAISEPYRAIVVTNTQREKPIMSASKDVKNVGQNVAYTIDGDKLTVTLARGTSDPE